MTGGAPCVVCCCTSSFTCMGCLGDGGGGGVTTCGGLRAFRVCCWSWVCCVWLYGGRESCRLPCFAMWWCVVVVVWCCCWPVEGGTDVSVSRWCVGLLVGRCGAPVACSYRLRACDCACWWIWLLESCAQRLVQGLKPCWWVGGGVGWCCVGCCCIGHCRWDCGGT